MIPSEWADRARAPRGKILVVHRGVDSFRHGLYVAPQYLKFTRTAVGTVVDIHPSCRAMGELDYDVGDHVLLSSSGGQIVVFGLMPTEEREIWVYSPLAVRLIFETSPGDVVDEGESHLRYQKSLRAKIPLPDRRYAEGDPRGPR